MKRIALLAIAGVAALTACEDTRPVVRTNEQHIIEDMPAGVRWDVHMDSALYPSLGAMGEVCVGGWHGEYNVEAQVCEDVDY